MRIVLIGRGKMGKLIQETAHAAGDQVEAAFGHGDLDQLAKLGKVADVVIDFSRPEALPEICSYVKRTGTPLLSGTTGYSAAELEQLRALGKDVPVLLHDLRGYYPVVGQVCICHIRREDDMRSIRR